MTYTSNGYYSYPIDKGTAVPDTYPKPYPDKQPAMMGWQCPKCGGVNAPHVNRCGCTPLPMNIMYGTGNMIS